MLKCIGFDQEPPEAPEDEDVARLRSMRGDPLAEMTLRAAGLCTRSEATEPAKSTED